VSLPAFRATEPQQHAILAHYERVAPLIVANFPHAPLVVSYYPDGLGTQPTYSGGTWTKPLPESIPRTTVTTRSGVHTYPTCAVNTILWLLHHYGVGIHSWTPSKDDPEAVGVARILFTPVGHAGQPLLKEALLALRSVLRERGVDAVPLYEGEDAALFIPLADAPPYEPVRAWLHDVVDTAIARHPTLLVRESRPHEQHNVPRIECTVASNAVGHHSRLPYALSGDPDLPMVTPFDWSELNTLHNGQITAANAEERLAAKGDLYATLAATLAHQRFAGLK
jgi:DNA primase